MRNTLGSHLRLLVVRCERSKAHVQAAPHLLEDRHRALWVPLPPHQVVVAHRRLRQILLGAELDYHRTGLHNGLAAHSRAQIVNFNFISTVDIP